MNPINRCTIAALLAIAAMCDTAHAETSFTYQGRLGNAAIPAEGQHDFAFRLFDAEAAGTQIGADLNYSPVLVSNGIFTVQLDFGDTPFNSNPRWLEIAVRETGAGSYTTLSPRQRIGASPFAIETIFVGPGAVDTAALQDNSVTTNKIANGNVFTDDLANFAVATGKLSNQAVTRLKVANDAIGTSQIEDGTITSDDVDGSIYARKGQVYSQISTASITFGINGVSVSCLAARDLPVVHVCNVPSDNSDLTILSERLTSIDNDVNPARLRCTAQNRDPQNAEILSATIWCLSVP